MVSARARLPVLLRAASRSVVAGGGEAGPKGRAQCLACPADRWPSVPARQACASMRIAAARAASTDGGGKSGRGSGSTNFDKAVSLVMGAAVSAL